MAKPNGSSAPPPVQPDAVAATATLAEKCSQCKTNDLDTTGLPKWCRECRARYQRERTVLRADMKENMGFAKGVRAMRELLAEEFLKLPNGYFSGTEIAGLIMRAPGPPNIDEEVQTP